MKIGIIQASSQKDKNELIFECSKKAIDENTNTVVNFGILLPQLDKSLIQKVLQRDVVFDYIMKYGTNPRLQTMLKELRDEK